VGVTGGDIDGVSIEKRKVRVLPPSATWNRCYNFENILAEKFTAK
jgi:hypothetical protein